MTTDDLIKRYQQLDAIDDPSTDELDEWRDLAEALMPELIALLCASQADYAAVAHATGIEYVPDVGASSPGPVDAVVKAIEQGRRAEGDLIDAQNAMRASREESEEWRLRFRASEESAERERRHRLEAESMRRMIADRLATIVDEAIGIQPVMAEDRLLTMLERRLCEDRAAHEALRATREREAKLRFLLRRGVAIANDESEESSIEGTFTWAEEAEAALATPDATSLERATSAMLDAAGVSLATPNAGGTGQGGGT